jgi:hypothetical protein
LTIREPSRAPSASQATVFRFIHAAGARLDFRSHRWPAVVDAIARAAQKSFFESPG